MKENLRRNAMEARLAMDPIDVEIRSLRILENLKVFEDRLRHRNVFIFIDFKKEVMTAPIIRYLESIDARVFIPRIDMASRRMEIHPYHGHDALVLSRYGIPEPPEDPSSIIQEEILDVVITPGVAFDSNGYRIGYGGGYYDRLFAKIGSSVLKIAVGFELQRVESIPAEAFDLPVDHLVTEEGVYSF